MNKPKLNQPNVDFIYRSEVANKKLENMSSEECQKLFGIKTTDPTIEEVKKEWEDDGWEWTENEIYIHITKRDKLLCVVKDICITKQDKEYCCYDEDEDYSCLFITFKEHIRLTKTFRALSWKV